MKNKGMTFSQKIILLLKNIIIPKKFDPKKTGFYSQDYKPNMKK